MTRASNDLARTALDFRVAVGRIGRRVRQIYMTTDSSADPGFLEISVLLRLDRQGPLTSKALAEIESVTPQAIGTSLSALEGRGLVARSRDRTDRRRVITTITNAGRKVLASREHAMNERMTTAFMAGFDASERRQLAAVIPLLERFADEL
jgi:DNA-binding MarR family transcriptional regulator